MNRLRSTNGLDGPDILEYMNSHNQKVVSLVGKCSLRESCLEERERETGGEKRRRY